MWSRLDDALIDHSKLLAAGEALGRNGAAIALGFYTLSLLWSNKHLTDGHLPIAVVKSFHHVDKPLIVAEVFVQAGLFDRDAGGFQIHDFTDFNPTAIVIEARRRRDRQRKQPHDRSEFRRKRYPKGDA